MKRFAMLCALVLGGVVLAACDKPTPEACEQALRNVSKLLGTENLNSTATLQGEVRQCRGGSTKKTVECAIAAKSLDELEKCDFEKISPHPLGSGAGAGSAAGAGGTAAGGAAPGGAAASGAAPGGAAPGGAPAGGAAPAGSGH